MKYESIKKSCLYSVVGCIRLKFESGYRLSLAQDI